MLTFTIRAQTNTTDGHGLGVRAVLLDPVVMTSSPAPTWDFHNDRIVVSEQPVAVWKSGGGFGNTLQLLDGALLTAYSYSVNSTATGLEHRLEAVRWQLLQLP